MLSRIPVKPNSALFARCQERKDEDAEKEHQLNKCQGDEHNDLKPRDDFRLARHCLKCRIADDSQSKSAAQTCDSNSNS
jgi:hypothetical protein